MQEKRELKKPKAMPGHSGEKMPGRSKAHGDKEVKEEEGEVRRVENEVMNAILTAGPIESTIRDDVGDVVEERRNAERSSGGSKSQKSKIRLDLSEFEWTRHLHNFLLNPSCCLHEFYPTHGAVLHELFCSRHVDLPEFYSNRRAGVPNSRWCPHVHRFPPHAQRSTPLHPLLTQVALCCFGSEHLPPQRQQLPVDTLPTCGQLDHMSSTVLGILNISILRKVLP